MSRLKAVLLSLVAVFAFSAVAAASASAHSYWVSGTELLEGEKREVEGTSGTSLLVAAELTVICTRDVFTGTIKGGGDSTATVKFTECSVEAAPRCAVTEPIEFNVGDHLTSFEEKIGDAFEPEAGGTFVTIKVTGGECSLAGKYEVKGKQQCGLGANAEREQEEHEIVCTPAGSELKFGKKAATFEGTDKVKLKGGGNWSALL